MTEVKVLIYFMLRISSSFLGIAFNAGHRKKHQAYLLEIATVGNELELVSLEILGAMIQECHLLDLFCGGPRSQE